MRRMLVLALLVAGVATFVRTWRRTSREGAVFVNGIVNPFLLGRGLIGSGHSHLATLEHVGRRSGTRRLTPLHPILTAGGVRFAVPLGDRSEWVRNVLAAGHCRMQHQDRILELDEPRLVDPPDVPGMNRAIAAITGWLGWKYLLLRRFDEHPGTLEPAGLPTQERVPSPAGDATGREAVAPLGAGPA